eukprot:4276698-Alexandrium_andersonii.AAC.1
MCIRDSSCAPGAQQRGRAWSHAHDQAVHDLQCVPVVREHVLEPAVGLAACVPGVAQWTLHGGQSLQG